MTLTQHQEILRSLKAARKFIKKKELIMADTAIDLAMLTLRSNPPIVISARSSLQKCIRRIVRNSKLQT